MVKLFYANLNLGHQDVSNQEDCIWSLACGKHIFFSLDRMAHILKTENDGVELSTIDVDLVV